MAFRPAALGEAQANCPTPCQVLRYNAVLVAGIHAKAQVRSHSSSAAGALLTALAS
jgi:hypothetical protein